MLQLSQNHIHYVIILHIEKFSVTLIMANMANYCIIFDIFIFKYVPNVLKSSFHVMKKKNPTSDITFVPSSKKLL